MTAAWDGVRPLLRHYRKTLIPNFDPLHVLPYTELPFNNTRHLVAASQLLATISRVCLASARALLDGSVAECVCFAYLLCMRLYCSMAI
jgi:hypothetical protein